MMKCDVCGCTDFDCSQCFEKTGSPCFWVYTDLCSTCASNKEIDEVMTDMREQLVRYKEELKERGEL